MFVMSGFSGQISSGAVLQSSVSGYIGFGQVSAGLREQLVAWGKVTVILGVLFGVVMEIVNLKVPPHLDSRGIVKPVDLGPVMPPILASGAIASGYRGSSAS